MLVVRLGPARPEGRAGGKRDARPETFLGPGVRCCYRMDQYPVFWVSFLFAMSSLAGSG